MHYSDFDSGCTDHPKCHLWFTLAPVIPYETPQNVPETDSDTQLRQRQWHPVQFFGQPCTHTHNQWSAVSIYNLSYFFTYNNIQYHVLPENGNQLQFHLLTLISFPEMKLLVPAIDIFSWWHAHWYVKYLCKQVAFFCIRKYVREISIPTLIYSRLYEEINEAQYWRKRCRTKVTGLCPLTYFFESAFLHISLKSKVLSSNKHFSRQQRTPCRTQRNQWWFQVVWPTAGAKFSLIKFGLFTTSWTVSHSLSVRYVSLLPEMPTAHSPRDLIQLPSRMFIFTVAVTVHA